MDVGVVGCQAQGFLDDHQRRFQLELLAMGRLGMGLGEGGTAPINYSILAETFNIKQRGLVMSIVTAGTPIAGIITPVLVAWLAQNYGWRTAFIAIAK